MRCLACAFLPAGRSLVRRRDAAVVFAAPGNVYRVSLVGTKEYADEFSRRLTNGQTRSNPGTQSHRATVSVAGWAAEEGATIPPAARGRWQYASADRRRPEAGRV